MFFTYIIRCLASNSNFFLYFLSDINSVLILGGLRMKVIKKVLLGFVALSCSMHGLFNILPTDLDALIKDADTATKIHSTYIDKVQAIAELNKWYDLVANIYEKTSGIVGEQFLAVKQLSALKKQFKQELAKIKKEKNAHSAQLLYSALGKNPDGISHQALKQAVVVAQEAKKWLNKAHAQLKVDRKPKAHMKVAKR